MKRWIVRAFVVVILLEGLLMLGPFLSGHGPVAVAIDGAGIAERPGPGCRGVPDQETCSVLFIGNSHTAVNDLPGTFARLARSAGRHVATGAETAGGAYLRDFAGAPETGRVLASRRWNVVVLQDQQQAPASVFTRRMEFQPAARKLVARVRSAGAEPMLFETWARRGGWALMGMFGYDAMQGGLREGYFGLAAKLGLPVAAVGEAWRRARSEGVADDELWQPDGSHAMPAGTYLAACVFYVTVFGRSPVGLPYHAGLPAGIAERMQRIAAAA